MMQQLWTKVHLGFVFDKHQLEVETLDSKVAKGIMNIIWADFKQILISIFSFFTTIKTQEAYDKLFFCC